MQIQIPARLATSCRILLSLSNLLWSDHRHLVVRLPKEQSLLGFFGPMFGDNSALCGVAGGAFDKSATIFLLLHEERCTSTSFNRLSHSAESDFRTSALELLLESELQICGWYLQELPYCMFSSKSDMLDMTRIIWKVVKGGKGNDEGRRV